MSKCLCPSIQTTMLIAASWSPIGANRCTACRAHISRLAQFMADMGRHCTAHAQASAGPKMMLMPMQLCSGRCWHSHTCCDAGRSQ